MPRVGRKLSESKTYHVMIRGNERKDIFLDDEDNRTKRGDGYCENKICAKAKKGKTLISLLKTDRDVITSTL
jgi:REP element-mobilizing transposase RayT